MADSKKNSENSTLTSKGSLVEFHPKQLLAFESEATEIMFGGAAGGGKSHFLRLAAIIWCSEIPGLQVYFFRRTKTDLEANHMYSETAFPAMLSDMGLTGGPDPFAKVNESKMYIKFRNGSRITLCHCQYEKDRFNYRGPEMHVLMIDELTLFTERIYSFLRSRVRMPKEMQNWIKENKPQWANCFPRILTGTNPGGEGHDWVKYQFVDYLRPMEVVEMPKTEGGMKRQYIPSFLEDNPSLDTEDYEGKLEGMGDPELAKAMRHGIWDISVGARFDKFLKHIHVIPDFTPPLHWPVWMSLDWGSSDPFAVYWFTECPGDEPIEFNNGSSAFYRKGTIICFQEYYGIKKDKNGHPIPNRGVRLSPTKVGQEILAIEKEFCMPPVQWRFAGADIFRQSKIESMLYTISGEFAKQGLDFIKADNQRVQGWELIDTLLDYDPDEPVLHHPGVLVSESCFHLIRTLPNLPRDEKNRDDVAGRCEDHPAESFRYGLVPIFHGDFAPKEQEVKEHIAKDGGGFGTSSPFDYDELELDEDSYYLYDD